MRLEDFLLMRHELLLTLIAIIILIAEIFTDDFKKQGIRPLSIILMAIVTIVGFLPAPTGTLFGGMYQATDMRLMMKNILNIGALIVFIQSASWLKSDDNQNKVSEFFLLLISTLIGMNFMISSGDFLMFPDIFIVF